MNLLSKYSFLKMVRQRWKRAKWESQKTERNKHEAYRRSSGSKEHWPVLRRGVVASRRERQSCGRLSCCSCSSSVSSASSGRSTGEGAETLELMCTWLLLPLWSKQGQSRPWAGETTRRQTTAWLLSGILRSCILGWNILFHGTTVVRLVETLTSLWN